jgi:hypothetical protein
VLEAIAGAGPVSERRLAALTLLDVPCLAAMWALVAWAFGWRAMCVGLIFWGTNLAAGSNWNGGSILRQEWLLASAAGVCLLRRRRLVAAGAAITYAASLVIFPAFLALGVAIETLRGWARERRLGLSSEHQRLLAGAVLILFGVAAVFMGVNGYNTTRDSIKSEGITFGTADDPAVAKYADQWAGEQVTTGDQARAFGGVACAVFAQRRNTSSECNHLPLRAWRIEVLRDRAVPSSLRISSVSSSPAYFSMLRITAAGIPFLVTAIDSSTSST